MGISVAFYKKEIHGEDSHMSYSTCHKILGEVGLSDSDLRQEYFVSFSAKKIVHAFEKFLAKRNFWGDEKEVIFVKQILNQYREFIFRYGFKPTHFGGA